MLEYEGFPGRCESEFFDPHSQTANPTRGLCRVVIVEYFPNRPSQISLDPGNQIVIDWLSNLNQVIPYLIRVELKSLEVYSHPRDLIVGSRAIVCV